jgi:hypothetical protein
MKNCKQKISKRIDLLLKQEKSHLVSMGFEGKKSSVTHDAKSNAW